VRKNKIVPSSHPCRPSVGERIHKHSPTLRHWARIVPYTATNAGLQWNYFGWLEIVMANRNEK